MSEEKHKTIDGLLAEYRGYSAGMPPSYHVTMSWHDFRRMLDRFDAAHKRELSKIRPKTGECFGQLGDAAAKRERLWRAGEAEVSFRSPVPDGAPGNAAKLREALKELQSRLVAGVYDGSIDCHAALEVVEKALAAPPRNCDVGTAEEQAERFGRYCDKFTSGRMHCEACPCCGKILYGRCEFAWAQMPYDSEARDGE